MKVVIIIDTTDMDVRVRLSRWDGNEDCEREFAIESLCREIAANVARIESKDDCELNIRLEQCVYREQVASNASFKT